MDPSEYELILSYLMTDSYPHGFTEHQKRNLRKRASKYLAINDKLVKLSEGKQLIVIKTDDIPSILREIHDNVGHQCARYSYNIAKARYFWPGMLKQIRSYVNNCIRCQKNQPTLKATSIPLQPLPVITRVWFRVGMDLTGPLVNSEGYKYILTMMDHFTKWIETRPLRSKEAKEVAKGIFSIYCRQGAPVQIICDDGTEFTNKISKALHDAYDCKLIFSAPYHPQTNGLVESAHKTLKRCLVKSLDEKNENWAQYFEEITFSLNIRPRDTTGFSAFELMHGSRKPRLPTEAENLAMLYPDVAIEESQSLGNDTSEDTTTELIQSMQAAQANDHVVAGELLTRSKELMKRRHDNKLNPITFNNLDKTDEVLIENVYQKKKGWKFHDKWLGPYRIAKLNRNTVHPR